MEEAERCDRLAIYAEGNVVALGTPAELKSEIGGDVILLEADEPDALAQHIEQRFGLQAAVLDHQVRLEIENGHRFVTDVVEAFPGEIRGSVGSQAEPGRCVHPAHGPSLLDRAGRARSGVSKWLPELQRYLHLHLHAPAQRRHRPAFAFALWWREIVRFYRQRSRVVGVIASPLLFWLVIGSGFGTSFRSSGAAASIISTTSSPAR